MSKVILYFVIQLCAFKTGSFIFYTINSFFNEFYSKKKEQKDKGPVRKGPKQKFTIFILFCPIAGV